MPPPPAPSGGSPRSALPFILSGIMIVIYFSFIWLVGYHKELLGTTIVPGLSWGILLGALVIISAWVLTYVYVLASDKKEGARK